MATVLHARRDIQSVRTLSGSSASPETRAGSEAGLRASARCTQRYREYTGGFGSRVHITHHYLFGNGCTASDIVVGGQRHRHGGAQDAETLQPSDGDAISPGRRLLRLETEERRILKYSTEQSP